MVRSSSYPEVEVPDCDLWSFLFQTSNQRAGTDRALFIDAATSRSYNFGDVESIATAFGKFLSAKWDWKKGQTLAFFTPNSIDVPPLIWGCLWAGGIVTTANPAYKIEELSHQLRDSQADGIVTQAASLPIVKQAAECAGISRERILLIDSEQIAGFTHLQDVLETDMSGASLPLARVVSNSHDIAFLVYSSGTTGRPKGVMLSHRNVIANILMLNHETGWMAQSYTNCTMLSFLPFFHIYGLVRLVHDPFVHGIASVVMKRFDLETFCTLVQQYRVVFAHVVPPVLLALSKDPVVSKYDLSSLKMLSSGAAPLTWPLTKAVNKRIAVAVKQAYGLSETSPTTHSQEWEDWSRFQGSVGRLLPNQEVKYLDLSGEEVAPGTAGEICIRGPNVFQGYWRNKSATENAFTKDGFFKTGDIGLEDEHGNLYITDRAKELIKYKGFQVAPAELEDILIGHPKVLDAAVIGVWMEEQATELPRAYIVPSPSIQAESRKALEKEVQDWTASRVASHKRLRGGVQVVDVIPKSPSGKILRRVLRDMASTSTKRVQAKL